MDVRSPEEIRDVRRRLIEIEFHEQSDEQFLDRLRKEPLQVLREHGFDESTTDEMLLQPTGQEAMLAVHATLAAHYARSCGDVLTAISDICTAN